MRMLLTAALGALAAGWLASPISAGEPPAAPAPLCAAPAQPILTCCDDYGRCEKGNRLWGSAEYLMWWIKDNPLPVPLVTSGSFLDDVPGALGQTNTRILIGGSNIDNGMRSGGRFTVGCWLGDGQTLGLEGSYLFLAQRSINQSVSSNGQPGSLTLFGPFIANPPGREDALQISDVDLPGRGTGSLSSQLQGAELNAVSNLTGDGRIRLDLLGGFRFLNLHEGLSYSEVTTNPTNIPEVLLFNNASSYVTRNRFYGGQVGVRTEYSRGNWFVNATGKIALGDMHEIVTINGTTVVPETGTVLIGGSLAQLSNIGQFSHDRFAVVPEVGVNIGYQLGSWARVFVGYSFLYLSDVVRPGDQIDRNVNVSRTAMARYFDIPPSGPELPAVLFKHTDFWAQGINFGLEFRY